MPARKSPRKTQLVFEAADFMQDGETNLYLHQARRKRVKIPHTQLFDLINTPEEELTTKKAKKLRQAILSSERLSVILNSFCDRASLDRIVHALASREMRIDAYSFSQEFPAESDIFDLADTFHLDEHSYLSQLIFLEREEGDWGAIQAARSEICAYFPNEDDHKVQMLLMDFDNAVRDTLSLRDREVERIVVIMNKRAANLLEFIDGEIDEDPRDSFEENTGLGDQYHIAVPNIGAFGHRRTHYGTRKIVQTRRDGDFELNEDYIYLAA